MNCVHLKFVYGLLILINNYSDVPGSYDGLNPAQFNANDFKDIMTLSSSSAHDQIPKEITQMPESFEKIAPNQMTSDQTTIIQNVTGISDNVSHESYVAMTATTTTTTMTATLASQPKTSLENTTTPITAEPTKDLEAASPTKAQPVRKISRFLVSPAILTVANEKTVQSACAEEPINSPSQTANTIAHTPNNPTSTNAAAVGTRIEYHQMPIQNQVNLPDKDP